jgi:hypothetical protein
MDASKINVNVLGYGHYVDGSSGCKLPIFVKDHNCLSRLIDKIAEIFKTIFEIKPNSVHFTHQNVHFQVKKSDLLKFVENEMRAGGVEGVISRERIKPFLPKPSAKAQDFTIFLASVKAGVIALKGVNELDKAKAAMKDALKDLGKKFGIV